MQTYRETGQPDVIHDETRDRWFPRDPKHPDFIEMQAGIDAKTAQLLPFQPTPVTVKRSAAYNAAGVTKDAMIFALWEKVMEDRPDKAAALQAIREQVKAENPK